MHSKPEENVRKTQNNIFGFPIDILDRLSFWEKNNENERKKKFITLLTKNSNVISVFELKHFHF